MSVQGTLGSMLQGVSQQPTRIRRPGQVTDQINFLSDVAAGVTSRPATQIGGTLTEASPDLNYREIKFGQDLYYMGFKTGKLLIWDLMGNPQTLVGGDSTYLTDDMQFHVISDKDDVERAYATNRTTKVTMMNEVKSRFGNVAIVTALGGAFSRTYKVTVRFDLGQHLYAEYTTPDGSGSGDAEEAASERIIKELYSRLGTRLGAGTDADPYTSATTYVGGVITRSLPVGTTVDYSGDVLLIEHPTQVMKVTVEDGDAGTILRGMSDTVSDVTDLPKLAPHGTTVLVSGDAAADDDYYLQFEVKDTSGDPVDGTGFGVEGVWTETSAPGLQHKLNAYSMPHTLIRYDDGTFEFGIAEWEPRKVGDDETCPLPSFVGKVIRDIGSFESRLVFLAGSNMITSRSRRPLDMFRKSATVLSDSDPIDMYSTKEGSTQLDWIVPFDRDLLLISDPGSAQYVVTSGGLTPTNASMALTTSYQMEGNTRPVTTGRTLMFPFNNGDYSGIKEFFTNDTVATNGADTLTEVQPQYIHGQVDHLASSENFNLLLLKTDSPDHTNVIWVYQYLWDNGERIQSSWSKWEFSDEVVHFFFDNSFVYIAIRYAGVTMLTKMDLNKPVDSFFGYHVNLDRQQIVRTTADTTRDFDAYVDVEYADAVFVQRDNCPFPGIEAKVVRTHVVGGTSGIDSDVLTDRGYRYHFDSSIAPNMSMVAGKRIPVSLTPSMPVVKDRFGNTESSARIVVNRFVVHVEDTGNLEAVMTSPYRETYTFEPHLFPLDDDALDPNGLILHTQPVDIPWGEDTNSSELTIKSSDVRPTTILEIEWEGNITGRKRRV